MECLGIYPIVPTFIENVMKSCVVRDYELPVRSRVYIAQRSVHYMKGVFLGPFKFDIDRYLIPRNERLSPGYAP